MAKLLAYKASAGSGKTFTLTKEFLLLLFADEMSFRNILAITFTNKASAEMKGRIISQLYALSSGQDNAYRDIISKELGLSNDAIIDKSKSILSKILHNYSFFFVETIDKFNQRVVRNFAKELGIYSLQNVELDNNRILELALKQLFIDIDKNEEIRTWLHTFISHQIAVGENYNVRKSIMSIAKEMFSESVSIEMQENEPFFNDRSHIDTIYNNYETIVNQTDDCFQEIADNAFRIMNAHDVGISDFSYGEKGAANYFNKIKEGNYEPTKRVFDVFNDASLLVAKSSKKKQELQQCIDNGLYDCFKEAEKLLGNVNEQYYTGKALLDFRYTFPMIHRLFSIVMDYCRENDIHLLSNNNILLRQIIGNESAPFLYEKMGTFLKHFMLDEFQDTSSLQWDNVKPLLSNGLGEGYDSLVVGDVKQSIYRWRNGDWKLLADKLPNDKEIGTLTTTKYLDFNYRSDKVVVDFNNYIFKGITNSVKFQIEKIITDLENDENIPDFIKYITELTYKDVAQKTPEHTQKNGYVSLEFLPSKEFDDLLLDKLPKIIMQLQDNGYKASDIAIIVRSNKECKKIVDILLDFKKQNNNSTYTFDVVSSEALALGRSAALRLVINFLKATINGNDAISKYAVLEDYKNHFAWKTSPHITSFEHLLSEFDIAIEKKNSLFEKCEEIIGKLNLTTNDSFPYIKDFQDIVLQHSCKTDYSIQSFIDWWNEKGNAISVKLPEGQSAIQVLTIHKSKGLEFEAVILPYCSWEIYSKQSILWAKQPESGFPIHPIWFKNSLKNSLFRNDYVIEKAQQLFDNLNLLYVAFTRAKKCMFILSESPTKDSEISSNVGHLLYNSLESKLSFIEFGTLQKSKHKPHKTINSIPGNYLYYGISKHVHFATHSDDYFSDFTEQKKRSTYGVVMHSILSNIEIQNDIVSATEKAKKQGLITEIEQLDIQNIIKTSIKKNNVSHWFDGTYEIMNETAILLPDNSNKRPDRVMIKDNNVCIVDYKFTKKKDAEHIKQIHEYANIITQMGFECKAFLWYITLDSITEV